MEQIVFQFLKRLKIPISSQYVETFLLTHPEFPSLLSVSDLLENLKLVHSIKRINREEIESLESPCLILPERSAKGLISVLTVIFHHNWLFYLNYRTYLSRQI